MAGPPPNPEDVITPDRGAGWNWRGWLPSGVTEAIDWVGQRLPQASPEMLARFEQAQRDADAQLAATRANLYGAIPEPVKQIGRGAVDYVKSLADPGPQLTRGGELLKQQLATQTPTTGVPAIDWTMAPQRFGNQLAADTLIESTTPVGAVLNAPELPLGKVGGLAMAAPARLLKGLERRWPGMSRALATHGEELTLPGARRSYSTALDRLAQDVHARTLRDQGTTMYPLTGATEQIGTPGFMVGRYSNQSGKTKAIPLTDFTPDDVRAFLEEHADEYVRAPKGDRNPVAIGTWIQDVNGVPHVYLDVAEKFPTARKATVQAARQKQPPGSAVRRLGGMVDTSGKGQWEMPQEAIFDLQAGESLPVGNLAEFLASEEFQQRLAEMYQAGVPVMNGKEWWNLFKGPLERVYGRERIPQVAGALASTSPASAPVHNLRSASEYIRRLIKGEPIIQPEFRIPETAVGSRPGSMGAMAPGDFNAPGTQMPMEATRAPNLRRVEAGKFEELQKDKVNDMFRALTGHDIGVYDRRYAKLAEDPTRGIYVDATKDKVPGTMGTTQVSPYALIENAVREGAQRHNMPVGRFSAYVWEGIGDTIKKTGELYGTKHPAHTIPTASQGFAGIFEDMIKEKAGAWGISVAEFKRRLRSGDAELLGLILSTPAGLAAYQQWQSEAPTPGSASRPEPRLQ